MNKKIKKIIGCILLACVVPIAAGSFTYADGSGFVGIYIGLIIDLLFFLLITGILLIE